MATANPYIVITTINAPSTAVQAFAARPGTRLIVVGDRKTPSNWGCDGVEYLPATAQPTLGFRVTNALPWNHYCRKNVGYLQALRQGATTIIDTDDDNLPYDDWAFPPFEGMHTLSPTERGFVNIYANFTTQRIWPRGFPLERLRDPLATLHEDELRRRPCRVGVWQGLADDDPDVDAIYRLTDNTPCRFTRRHPLVLATGTVCPFNSQNTATRRELAALLYMPAFATPRFTDILRGLVAQPVLWAAGYQLGFLHASVSQQRNPHNYLVDFEAEIPCYRHAQRVIEVAREAVSSQTDVRTNLRRAYAALVGAGVADPRELPVLDAWLTDVAELTTTVPAPAAADTATAATTITDATTADTTTADSTTTVTDTPVTVAAGAAWV